MIKLVKILIYPFLFIMAHSALAGGPIRLNDFRDQVPIMPEPGTAVVVDFGQMHAQASMSGFLSSIDPGAPSDSQITALQPALIRGDPAQALVLDGKSAAAARHALLSGLGTRYTLVVSNVWGYPKFDFRGKGPPAQNLTAFRTMVTDLATRVRDQNLGGQVIFDIWNEPNGVQFAPGSEADHLQVYLAAERIIHAVLPNALVAGPSLTGYEPARIRRFLDFCLANGCEVNVLSWHELLAVVSLPKDPGSNILDIATHIRTMRTAFVDNPRYGPLKLQRIHINEYSGPKDQYRPGELIAYLEALEAGGADAAVKSCWDRIRDQLELSNCFNGSLDGLFSPGGAGRLAPFWVYSTYAKTTSRRAAAAVPDPRLAVLAGPDAQAPGQAQILIGHTRLIGLPDPGLAPVRLELHNPGAIVPVDGQGRIHVLARRIPDSGEQVVTQLQTVFERDVALDKSGVLRALVDALPVHTGLIVTLSAPGAKAKSQIRPPQRHQRPQPDGRRTPMQRLRELYR